MYIMMHMHTCHAKQEVTAVHVLYFMASTKPELIGEHVVSPLSSPSHHTIYQPNHLDTISQLYSKHLIHHNVCAQIVHPRSSHCGAVPLGQALVLPWVLGLQQISGPWQSVWRHQDASLAAEVLQHGLPRSPS